MIKYTVNDYIKHYNKIMIRIFILVLLLPIIPAILCVGSSIETWISLFLLLFVLFASPIFLWCIYHKKDAKYAFSQIPIKGTCYHYNAGESSVTCFDPDNATEKHSVISLGKISNYRLRSMCVYGRKGTAYITELEDPANLSDEEKKIRKEQLNKYIRLPKEQLQIYITVIVVLTVIAIIYLIKSII